MKYVIFSFLISISFQTVSQHWGLSSDNLNNLNSGKVFIGTVTDQIGKLNVNSTKNDYSDASLVNLRQNISIPELGFSTNDNLEFFRFRLFEGYHLMRFTVSNSEVFKIDGGTGLLTLGNYGTKSTTSVNFYNYGKSFFRNTVELGSYLGGNSLLCRGGSFFFGPLQVDAPIIANGLTTFNGNVQVSSNKSFTANGPAIFNSQTTIGNVTTSLSNILNVYGRVGIGKMADPNYKLDVQGNISNEGADFVLGRGDGRSQGKEELNGQYNFNRALVHFDNDLLVLNFAGDFDGGTQVNGSKFVVDGNLITHGRLSIGTADPKGYKLAVNGSAIATSFTVQKHSNWPDYVFHSNYELMSLKDLGFYLNQNHHLPNVPSAQEVAEKGINLGEMDAILLEKIEELTLYLLQLNADVEKLKKENEILKALRK